MALTKVTSGLISADASSVDLNIDAGTLYIDATNNRVGVGTTSPLTTLQAGTTGISSISGAFSAHQAVDGDAVHYFFNSTQATASSTNETCQLYLGWRDAASGIGVAPRIVAGKEGDYTTAAGADSFLAFHTTLDNTLGEKVRITSAGKVGIGTGSPNAALQIGKGAAAGPPAAGASTGAVCFGNDTSANAYGLVMGADGFGKGYISAQRTDGTAATYDLTIQPNGGNVLFGVTTFSNNGSAFRAQASNLMQLNIGSSATSAQNVAVFRNPNGAVGTISTNGSATAYNTSSDYRLKENVEYDWDATTRLKQLKPARFNFISDADTTVDGFLAHEVSSIVPEAILGEKDEMQTEEYEVTPAVLDDDGNVVTEAVMGTREVPKYQGIDQSKLVPLLVKTIQELEARITALENA